MLLIPKAVHEILERGRAEGRQQGKRELLEQLVKDNEISEERLKEFEEKMKEK